MTWAVVAGAVIGAGGAYLSSQNQADAAQSAASTSSQASDRAAQLQLQAQQESNALQKEMYYKNIELQQPWREAGQNALSRLTAGINAGQFGTATPFSFTAQDFAKQQDPGYAFRLAEGNRALNQSAAARGGLISGNALKAAQRYGQEMGSQEFQNAYSRALTGYNASQQAKTNAYNQLAGVSGTGQTSAQQIGAAGSNYASNVGNTAMNVASSIGNYGLSNAANQGNALMAAANARSSAYQGYGSALGQGISGLTNYFNSPAYTSGGTGWATSGRTGAVDPYSDAGMSNFYG